MDPNNDEHREQLAGAKGAELVKSCTSEKIFKETTALLTNALIIEEENDDEIIRNGLCENICYLIIHRSKLTPSPNDAKLKIQKANVLCNEIIEIIRESETGNENIRESLFNVARKPNSENNYGWFIPALTIIYNISYIGDDLDQSSASHAMGTFEEDDWHTNLINLLPKRLFGLPSGFRPTYPNLMKMTLPLLSMLKAQDFHTGFGKVIPFQLNRFPADTLDTLCSLCFVVRQVAGKKGNDFIQALEFHFKNGMNYNNVIMKHLTKGGCLNAKAENMPAKLCKEYLYMNTVTTADMIMNALMKHFEKLMSEEEKRNYYSGLADIVVFIQADKEKEKFIEKVKFQGALKKFVDFVMEKETVESDQNLKTLLNTTLTNWESLLQGREDVKVQADESSDDGSFMEPPTESFVPQEPVSEIKTAIKSDTTSKSPPTQEEPLPEPIVKPGAAPSVKEPEEVSRKLQAEGSSKSGKNFAAAITVGAAASSESSQAPVTRKIQAEASQRVTSVPAAASSNPHSALNRKISMSAVTGAASTAARPSVTSESSRAAVDRKISSSHLTGVARAPNSAVTARNRKIASMTDVGASRVASVSNLDSSIDRKLSTRVGVSSEPSTHDIGSNKIRSDVGAAYSSDDRTEAEQRKSKLANVQAFKSPFDDKNKFKLLQSNADQQPEKVDKLLEEEEHYENPEEHLASVEEFRHTISRTRKDKKKEKKKALKDQPGWDSENNLAIAVAVDEDDFDETDPIFAEEYDPDYKPKLYQNPKVMLRIIGCFIIILVCVTGVIVTFTKQAVYEPEPTAAPTVPPTPSPTSIRDTLKIDEFISDYFAYNFTVDEEKMSLYEINRKNAMNWIVNLDGKQLTTDDVDGKNEVLQRYILILLYLSTSGDDWRHCAGNDGYEDFNITEDTLNNDTVVVDGAEETSRMLRRKLRILQETGDETWKEDFLCNFTDYYGNFDFSHMWASPLHECEWFGLLCNKDDVVLEILLQDNELVGTLPWELSRLPYLRRLWVNANSVTGKIPTEFGEFQHMADIQLHGNKFHGSIPEEIFNITTLQALNLAINDFTGTISTRFGELRNIKGIHLFQNHLTGTIPPEIGNLQYLAYGWFYQNVLEGPIPTTIGKLNEMIQFSLSYNNLVGTIPTEVGNLKDVESFMVENNQLTGTIPDEIYSLSNLKYLYVQTNKLSGTISEKVGNLTSAQRLIFRENNLRGTIPSVIGTLKDMNNLWFHYNDFTGTMPAEICALVEMEQFQTLYADCDDQMGAAAVECECCTDCCDNTNKVCYSQ